MIFQHTWQKVLSGEKTQTRRIVKPGDGFTTPLSISVIGKDRGRVITTVPNYGKPSPGFNNIYSVCNGNRTVYAVGKDYAVQPGRGQYAFTQRIEIIKIRRQDVRDIDAYDARAEGFETWMGFLDTWLSMHDKPMLNKWEHWLKRLENRPAERYQAWVLTFELVK